MSAPRKIASEEYLVLGDDEEAHWEVTENFFLCFVFRLWANLVHFIITTNLIFHQVRRSFALVSYVFDLPLLICMKLCSCWFFYSCFARVKSQKRLSFHHKKVGQFKPENSFSVKNEKNSKNWWKTSSTMLRPFSYFELMVISWNFCTRGSDKSRRSYIVPIQIILHALLISFISTGWLALGYLELCV